MSKLAHNVFFSLKEPTDANRRALVDACKKYLTDHPGIGYFAAGVLEPTLDRPVNQRDFDVSLHIVFASRADHDAYQDAPRHHQFIEENRNNWASVRVFDSVVD
jgi:hypothetical protein